jgi:hypothetical protein
MTETIDITPTWKGILPVLTLALELGSDKGRDSARQELARMAEAADRFSETTKVREMLATMTGLVKLKYGNLDPEIWKLITDAEAITGNHCERVPDEIPLNNMV